METTGLSGFVHQSNLKMALKLIRDGADINGRYEHGTRPIVAAINSCQLETLRFVVDQGANVNIDDGYPTRVMIDFVIDSMIQSEREEPYPEDMKMLKVLLENGANVELEDENRERPIDIISLYAAGSPEVLNQLKRIFAPLIPNINDLL